VTVSERPKDQSVVTVPSLTLLESSAGMAKFLNAIKEEVGRLNWQKLKVEKDNVDHVLNRLHELVEPFCTRDYL